MKTRETHGFTLIELLIVVAIIGIVAAIAVPGLLRARMAGNEAAAIGSLRAISAAQAIYAASCGGGGYASTLQDLYKAPIGTSVGFISPDLQTNNIVKSGYLMSVRFDLNPIGIMFPGTTCNTSVGGTYNSYFASATPVTVGSSGQRSFATDVRGVVYYQNNGQLLVAGMDGATMLQ